MRESRSDLYLKAVVAAFNFNEVPHQEPLPPRLSRSAAHRPAPLEPLYFVWDSDRLAVAYVGGWLGGVLYGRLAWP